MLNNKYKKDENADVPTRVHIRTFLVERMFSSELKSDAYSYPSSQLPNDGVYLIADSLNKMLPAST